MEPFETPPTQLAPQPAPKRSTKTALIVGSVFLLVAGLIGATYFFWQKSNKSEKAITPSSSVSTPVPVTESAPPVHYVQAIGYPFDVSSKKVTFNLGLPNSLQAVTIQSTIQNPGYTTYLTNKFNDELARFSVGNPKVPNATREISLIALGKEWLSSTTAKPDILEFEDVSTPAKKKQYAANLASTTRQCIEDSKKGFRTKDKTLSVCYSLSSGKDGWSPLVTLKGYATVEGTPVVLLGYVDLNDGKTLTDAEDLKLREEAAKGNYPASTNKLLEDLVNALSQSTLTITDR